MSHVSWNGSRWIWGGLLLGFALLSVAQEPTVPAPIRRIEIEVQPYYEAASDPTQPPGVRVGAGLDQRLASLERADILDARMTVQTKADVVTPMTMMVLAIRLYDVGEREEGLFWFYAAKDRAATLAAVLDLSDPGLRPAADAISAFSHLAGPYFNSYAFCDRARQHQARLRALAWVRAHPYQVLFQPQLPARSGNRQQFLDEALARIEQEIAAEKALAEDPEQWAAFQRQRRERQVDAQFCWSD